MKFFWKRLLHIIHGATFFLFYHKHLSFFRPVWDDRQDYVRWMVGVMVNRLHRFFHLGVGAEFVAGVGISVEPGEITARYLDPNPVAG